MCGGDNCLTVANRHPWIGQISYEGLAAVSPFPCITLFRTGKEQVSTGKGVLPFPSMSRAAPADVLVAEALHLVVRPMAPLPSFSYNVSRGKAVINPNIGPLPLPKQNSIETANWTEMKRGGSLPAESWSTGSTRRVLFMTKTLRNLDLLAQPAPQGCLASR